MKKILIAIGILVVVLIVVAIAAPFFIPTETYKAQVEQRVEAATGRKLTIAGPVKVSLLPSVAIVAKDVHFANAPGYSTPEMATLAGLELKLKVLPLLSGEVAIDSFVLDKPVIHLEVNKQGQPNWQFAKPGEKPAPQNQPQQKPQAGGGQGGGGLNELSLDNVKLNDGRITYSDAQSGAKYAAEAINVALSLPNLDSPFRADGGLTWNGKPIKLQVNLANPRAMMEGKSSALALNVNADLLRFDFKGNAANSNPLKIDGKLDLNVPNVRSLAAWVGQPLTVPGSGLGPFEIKGALAMAGPKMSFTGAELSLDAIRARGDVMVDSSGKVPYVKAKLDTNTLDLNPYLPPSTATSGSASKTPAAPGAAVPTPRPGEGWSTEPIDVSGLRAANADLSLGVEGLLIRKIKIGKGQLGVQLKGGKLTADLAELALYQGNGKGRVTVDGSGKVPGIGLDMTLNGVQAEPLLKDVMDMDRFSGTGQAQIQVNGSGASQADLMAALNGKGNVKFENGAIKGINLGAMVRNVSTAFLDAQAGRAEQTDFTELSGTFVIEKGILKNNDLTMQAPLLRLAGAGTVNLPQRSINYRVEPKIAATAEGQGGRRDARGVEIPVVISGSWDNLSYKPDLSGLLENPQGAVDSLRGILGGQGGSSGSGGSSGGSGTGSGGGQPAPSSPADQLRGLFGR
jgi:AsmA protein